MLNLATLIDAFGLAKMQEQYIWSSRRTSLKFNYVQSPLSQTSGHMARSKSKDSILDPFVRLPHKKIFDAHMQDRRRGGFCYYSYEKV